MPVGEFTDKGLAQWYTVGWATQKATQSHHFDQKEKIMLDFSRVNNKEISMTDLAADLTRQDLHTLTAEMIDTMLDAIADCTDADVTFQPLDPGANDTFASKSEDAAIAWTLAHVIVHTTASSEESAFLAAEMARGVENHGRSRYETPWEEVTTIEQCRQRLQESLRIRQASLELWPDQPNLEITYQPWPTAPHINAVARFIFGFAHDDSHLGQITDIVSQAKAARA